MTLRSYKMEGGSDDSIRKVHFVKICTEVRAKVGCPGPAKVASEEVKTAEWVCHPTCNFAMASVSLRRASHWACQIACTLSISSS